MRGMTPTSHILNVRGKRHSVITAMSTRGIENIHVVQNTVDGDMFLHFVQSCLVPILQPFDGTNPRSIVIMDNASIHHVDKVCKAICQTGAILRYLPPYSPDLQPLEEVFSKVKSFLKRNEIVYDSSNNPSLVLTLAFTTVTSEDCINYIKHAEYKII